MTIYIPAYSNSSHIPNTSPLLFTVQLKKEAKQANVPTICWEIRTEDSEHTLVLKLYLEDYNITLDILFVCPVIHVQVK